MPKQIAYNLTELSKKTNLEDAFKIMAFSCIAQVESNAAILVKTYDPEGLHQVRIGLFRFNSLLETYNNLLKLPETLRSELHWINQTLSESRDMDVLINFTLPMVCKKLGFLRTPPNLNLILHNEAKKIRSQLTTTINSKRCIKLIQNLKAFVFECDWPEGTPTIVHGQLSEQLDQVASTWLTKQRYTLINQGKNINSAGRKKLHRIRITVKRLRYTSEFLQSLYPSERVNAYIKKLSKLQDVLGFLHDATVANRRLKKIKTKDANFQKEMKLIRSSIQSVTEAKHKKIEALWNDFTSTKLN